MFITILLSIGYDSKSYDSRQTCLWTNKEKLDETTLNELKY